MVCFVRIRPSTQYKGMGLNVKALMLEIDFVRMAGVSDPETKRKLLDVFLSKF
jgi:hypothetical protein